MKTTIGERISANQIGAVTDEFGINRYNNIVLQRNIFTERNSLRFGSINFITGDRSIRQLLLAIIERSMLPLYRNEMFKVLRVEGRHFDCSQKFFYRFIGELNRREVIYNW